MRVHGSLFFGAVSHVQQRLQQIDEVNPDQKHVLIVADSVNFADIAGAEMLVQEARRRRKMGGGLYLIGLKERACEVLRKGGYLQEIGQDHVFNSKTKAISEIYGRLDQGVCQRCDKRIFTECASVSLGALPRRAQAIPSL